MRRTERLLLAILVTVVLLWQGNVLLRHFVLDPIAQRQNERSTLERDIIAKETEALFLDKTKDRLRQRTRISLPREPLTAQRLYQQWLTDLAQDSGFLRPKVYPEQVTNRQHGSVGVVVSIQAEVTLEQLCQFMDRFQATALLHQITSINIQGDDDRGNPPLQVTIVTEGLILPDAADRNQLFPSTVLADQIDDVGTAISVADGMQFPRDENFLVRIGEETVRVISTSGNAWKVSRGSDGSQPIGHVAGTQVTLFPMLAERTVDYRRLIANNPFAKPRPKVIAPTPRIVREEKKAGPDAAQFTFLVAAISKGDEHQAWLFDRLNNRNVVIVPGAQISIGDVRAAVLAIGQDHVLLDRDDVRWRLRVGKNLRSMERLPDG